MPGKARRVASRQSQLSRRKKRQQKGPGGIPSPATEPVKAEAQRSVVADSREPEPAAAPAAPSPVRPSASSPRPSTAVTSAGQPRSRGERPLSNTYIGPELRRILVMACTVLVIIVVLGIVL